MERRAGRDRIGPPRPKSFQTALRVHFATEGGSWPKGAPADLIRALELHYWGGPQRLTWTEFQQMDQTVLDFHAEIVAAAAHMKGATDEQIASSPRGTPRTG